MNKKLRLLTLVLAIAFGFGAYSAFGADLAPELVKINVSSVAHKGKLLERDHGFPSEQFTVGIPVVVDTIDTCTEFVGQKNIRMGSKTPMIEVVGAKDALSAACIELLPEPVDSVLTFRLKSFSMLPVRSAWANVSIDGSLHEVRVDLDTEEVTISRLMTLADS